MEKRIEIIIKHNITEAVEDYIEKNKLDNIVTYNYGCDDRFWMWEGIQAYFGIEDITVYPDSAINKCVNIVFDINGTRWCCTKEVYENFEKLYGKLMKKQLKESYIK